MLIELTKDQLDYLALKIAEILQQQNGILNASVNRKNTTSLADIPLQKIEMPIQLRNLIKKYNLEDWTPRDVSYFRKTQWLRLHGFGKRACNELEKILQSAQLAFGTHYFTFKDGKSKWDVIIEKPSERYGESAGTYEEQDRTI